jgi:glycosyl transferase family 25
MNDLDAAFVILLGRDQERGRYVREMLARERLPAELFDAVDGGSLTLPAIEELRCAGYLAPGLEDERSRGQIACALSHVHLLERIVELGYRSTLVLEDDFAPVPGFREELRERLRRAPADFDLIYLFNSNWPEPELHAVEGLEGLRRPVYPLGTVGYVVSRQGARRILEIVKPIWFTIDDMLARSVQAGRLTAYTAWPMLAGEHESFTSNIRGSGSVAPVNLEPVRRDRAPDAEPEPGPGLRC